MTWGIKLVYVKDMVSQVYHREQENALAASKTCAHFQNQAKCHGLLDSPKAVFRKAAMTHSAAYVPTLPGPVN